MTRNFIFSTAVSCLAIALPLSLPAQRFESHWYQPQYLPNVQDASNRIEQLSPHFAPVTIEKNNFYLESGFSFVSAEGGKSGIQLVFRKGRGASRSQGSWTWDSENSQSTEILGKDEIVTSIVFAEIGYFQIWKVPAERGPAKWCVVSIDRQTRPNDILCVGNVEDAQALVDSLATLVRANGGSLTPPFGMWAKSGMAVDTHRHLEQSGWTVSGVDVEGPVARSGIRVGDIVYQVNGKPCPGSGTFFDAYNDAAREGLDGGDVQVDLLRKGQSMLLVLHYPTDEGNQKQLSAGNQKQMTKR